MSNDGKIYITISDTRQGEGGGGKPSPSSPIVPTGSTEKKDAFGNGYLDHQFRNFISSQIQQAINYTIGNIGNFTGDYETQKNIQSGVSAVKQMAGIALAAYEGAKVGGPVGALIGMVVGTAGTFISGAYKDNSERIANNKTNRNIEIMRARIGLDGLSDGSRGTQN